MIGGAATALAISLVRTTEHPTPSLPPVRATELARAAASAGCGLRRGGQRASERPRVEGGRAVPTRPGTYDVEQPATGLVGAMRRGTIVIHYRPGVTDAELQRLTAVQRAVPAGTILAPERDMPYRVAVTAWRRLLGCDGLDARTLDAIRLFRGRYVGQGPDAPR